MSFEFWKVSMDSGNVSDSGKCFVCFVPMGHCTSEPSSL